MDGLLRVLAEPGHDGMVVLRVRGEVDHSSRHVLDDCVRAWFEPFRCRLLVVDLRHCSFFGAAGVHCLEDSELWLRSRGARLAIVVGRNRAVGRVLQVTGVDRQFHPYVDVPDVLRHPPRPVPGATPEPGHRTLHVVAPDTTSRRGE